MKIVGAEVWVPNTEEFGTPSVEVGGIAPAKGVGFDVACLDGVSPVKVGGFAPNRGAGVDAAGLDEP